MSKAARRARRAAPPRIDVQDAAHIIELLELAADIRPTDPAALASQITRHISRVAPHVLGQWRRSPVALRLDRDFLDALVDSDTDIPILDGWGRRLPYGAFAVVLDRPIVLSEEGKLRHYIGFVAAGYSVNATGTPGESDTAERWMSMDGEGELRDYHARLRYGPATDMEGLRFMWFFHGAGDRGRPGAQIISIPLAGDQAKGQTLGTLLAGQMASAGAAGFDYGVESTPVMTAASLQVAMYLASSEPDMRILPAEQLRRPNQLRDAVVADVGWRVGAALRLARTDSDYLPSIPEGSRGAGRRKRPHHRRAHWQHVRMATRDAEGQIVGDRLGVEGIDWHYEMRWYPPSFVNADLGDPTPTVRTLK